MKNFLMAKAQKYRDQNKQFTRFSDKYFSVRDTIEFYEKYGKLSQERSRIFVSSQSKLYKYVIPLCTVIHPLESPLVRA